MARVRRKRRRNWPLGLLIIAVILGAAIYVVVLPCLGALWQLRHVGDFHQAEEIQGLLESTILLRLLGVTVSSWFVFLGASFGSFLNVMAWRLPRGGTLRGSSHCPYCAQRIAFYDNVPILGWLHLRGRCRACRLPISPRYVMIEVFTAAVFYLLFCVELLSGGAYLPQFAQRYHWGSPWIGFTFDSALMAVYGHHAMLLTVLITSMLIEWDGWFLPLRLYAWMCALAVAISSIFVEVIPPEPWLATLPEWAARPAPSLLGMGLGGLIGWLAALSYGWGKQRRRDATDPGYIMLYATTGAFLGWKAVAVVAVIAALIDIPVAVQGLRWRNAAPPHSLSLMLAVAVLLLSWRAMDPWLSGGVIVACVVATEVAHWIGGGLRPELAYS